PALAAADNDSAIAQRWIIALLDRCIECVAIDMSDGKAGQLSVVNQPWRATAAATERAVRTIGEAIATEAGHRGAIPAHGCWRGPYGRSSNVCRGANLLTGVGVPFQLPLDRSRRRLRMPPVVLRRR